MLPMQTVKIYQLKHLSHKQFQRLKAVQMEAGRVWNLCCQTHKEARMARLSWPGRDALQKATKGQFALHSQPVQMVVQAFLATIETTRKLRQSHPQMKAKYPWRQKLSYPDKWPAQAVRREHRRGDEP